MALLGKCSSLYSYLDNQRLETRGAVESRDDMFTSLSPVATVADSYADKLILRIWQILDKFSSGMQNKITIHRALKITELGDFLFF